MIAYLVMLVFSVALAASPSAAGQMSHRMPAREGEICLVCNQRVHQADSAYLADGQRIALHQAPCCEGEFLERPARYLAKLRPNDILFSNVANVGIPGGWIWLGILVLSGLVVAGLCADMVSRRGRAPVGFRKLPLTREPVPCPGCGRQNHPSAGICAGCGKKLTPLVPSEVPAARA